MRKVLQSAARVRVVVVVALVLGLLAVLLARRQGSEDVIAFVTQAQEDLSAFEHRLAEVRTDCGAPVVTMRWEDHFATVTAGLARLEEKGWTDGATRAIADNLTMLDNSLGAHRILADKQCVIWDLYTTALSRAAETMDRDRQLEIALTSMDITSVVEGFELRHLDRAFGRALLATSFRESSDLIGTINEKGRALKYTTTPERLMNPAVAAECVIQQLYVDDGTLRVRADLRIVKESFPVGWQRQSVQDRIDGTDCVFLLQTGGNNRAWSQVLESSGGVTQYYLNAILPGVTVAADTYIGRSGPTAILVEEATAAHAREYARAFDRLDFISDRLRDDIALVRLNELDIHGRDRDFYLTQIIAHSRAYDERQQVELRTTADLLIAREINETSMTNAITAARGHVRAARIGAEAALRVAEVSRPSGLSWLPYVAGQIGAAVLGRVIPAPASPRPVSGG